MSKSCMKNVVRCFKLMFGSAHFGCPVLALTKKTKQQLKKKKSENLWIKYLKNVYNCWYADIFGRSLQCRLKVQGGSKFPRSFTNIWCLLLLPCHVYVCLFSRWSRYGSLLKQRLARMEACRHDFILHFVLWSRFNWTVFSPRGANGIGR